MHNSTAAPVASAVTRAARILAVLGIAAAVLAPSPVDAAQRPGTTASPGTSVSKSYPPLVASAPTSGVVDLDPETCGEESVLFCDTVPINVTAAGVVTILVSWKDITGHDGGESDIDVLLYNGLVKINGSETSAHPEQIKMKLPKGPVNLVVVHWGGANDGYKVATTVVPAKPRSAVKSVGAAPAPAPAAGSGRTPSAPAAPRNRTPSFASFGTRTAAPPVASDVATQERGAVASLGGNNPSGDAVTAAPPSSPVAANRPSDAGGDLGWFAWILAGLSPFLIGGVLVANRRSDKRAAAV